MRDFRPTSEYISDDGQKPRIFNETTRTLVLRNSTLQDVTYHDLHDPSDLAEMQ